MVNSQRLIYLAALIHPKQSLGKPATRKMVGGQPLLEEAGSEASWSLPNHRKWATSQPNPLLQTLYFFYGPWASTELGCLLDYPTDAIVAAPEGSTQYSGPPKKSRTQDALSLDLFPSSVHTSWTLWMGSLGVHGSVGSCIASESPPLPLPPPQLQVNVCI